MEIISVNLSEIMVTGKSSYQKVDKLIIIPNTNQIKVAANSFDLLSQLMLPNLNVDIVNRSISANINGKVELRINGVKVSLSEIETLKSADIIRVEYYEHPGVSFGGADAPSSVIDFIIRRPISGMLFSTDLLNAISTGFANDIFSMKMNWKKSELGINYSADYREYNDRYVNTNELYLLPNYSLDRQTTGFKTPFGYQKHNINISYNITEENKYVFNFVLRNEFYQRHSDNISEMIISNDDKIYQNDMKQANSHYQPSIDMDYLRQINSKQNIEFNLVANYLETNYKYNYFQTTIQDTLNTQNTITNEKQKSIIGELAYNLQMEKLKFSVGVKQKNIWDINDYLSSSQNIYGNSSFTYLYSQLIGTIKKISYQIGIAGVIDQYKGISQSYIFYAIRPNLDIEYSLNSNSTLKFSSSISTNTPTLNSLSNIDVQIDNLIVLRGNPNLKPYKSYFNLINYTYQKDLFTSNIEFSQSYHANPIMDDIYYEVSSGKVIETSKNQKNLQLYWPSMSFKIGPIFNKILSFNISGNYFYWKSIGYNYIHTLQDFYVTSGATLSYKNYSLLINARTRPQYLWGETVTYDENSSSIQMQYNKDPFIIGIGMMYPLDKDWNAGTKILSKIAQIDSWSHINDNGHMIYLKFSWNLAVGRKFSSGQKSLYNEGVQSGILTVPEQ